MEWTDLEFAKSQRAVENSKKQTNKKTTKKTNNNNKMEETGCEIICSAPNDPIA